MPCPSRRRRVPARRRREATGAPWRHALPRGLRSPWRQRREDIDSLLCPPVVEDVVTDETLPVVLTLPEHYKLPVYLFYYEGYQAAEIARMLGTAPATIRVRLNRARQQLKTALSGV